MLSKDDAERKKIGTLEEFIDKYDDQWMLLEVLEVDEQEEPTVGRMIAHSHSRKEIMEALRGSNLKDVLVMFSGDVPKPGTQVMF